MSQKVEYLKPDFYYHIYNRGNAKCNIFYTEANYLYFKSKYFKYVSPIVDTYAYCLMPNHFHFLVKIKPEKEIFELLKNENKLVPKEVSFIEFKKLGIEALNKILSKQFSNFFNGYSQAINIQESRTGSLFQKPYRKKEIDSDEYLKKVILYIHSNPVEHGFVGKINEWPHTSYASIISNSDPLIKGKEVINLFGDIDNFQKTHYNKNLINLVEDF
ncbi:MAG: transposase [Bacteroidetes bacterium]|nr:transposase [Bacteroidota bacterium]